MDLRILAVVFLWFFYSFPAAANYDIIIVAGQSNATSSGYGSFTDRLERFDTRIRQLGRRLDDDHKVIPVGTVVDGIRWDGLQHWKHGASRLGMGFGLPFARQYAKHALAPNRTVLMVPAAMGSTSILEWVGDLERHDESKLLYPDMIERAKSRSSCPATIASSRSCGCRGKAILHYPKTTSMA